MFIKKITLKNFKSFKELSINLNNFNVLVGANNSGKSNFIQVFRFIKDLVKYGLDKAISLQGGIEYIKNFKTLYNEPISINITFYTPVKDLEKIDNYISIYNTFPSLPATLKNILENSKQRKTFFYLLNFVIDIIEDIKVYENEFMFKFKDTSKYLPSFLVSEGIKNIISLIIALYFEDKKLVIIENVERNIHPSLISYIINMIKGDIKDKQVIITTHSPKVLKYSGLDNIFFVSRNKEGFSDIYKPADKETVKTFLQNEISIDELFIQNLI
jgi:predicted ATPase